MNLYGPTETRPSGRPADRASRGGAGADPDRPADRQHAGATSSTGTAAARSPVGVPGELYIGGAGVARGYLGRPGLTAERFVPDPFGARRARGSTAPATWRAGAPTATLEFLGRLDHQVKIRGFRIELGEIEAALRAPPGVREAVVRGARGRGRRRPRWWPTWSPRGAGAAGAPSCARFLARRLPDYMVPAAFVLLDALPLTPNGKLDRRALPAPDAAPAPGAGAYVAPRTPSRRCWPAIWAEVLGLERVGVARQLLRARRPLAAGHAGDVAACARRFGVRAAAARALRGADGGRRWPARVDGAAARRAPAAPPHPAACRAPADRCRCRSPSSGCGSSTSWSRAAPPTTCRWRVRLRGRARRGGAAARARTRSCARHEIAAHHLPRRGRRAGQVIAPAGAVAAAVRRSARAGRRRSARRSCAAPAGAERGAPFDLARGPLLRARAAAAGRRASTSCC